VAGWAQTLLRRYALAFGAAVLAAACVGFQHERQRSPWVRHTRFDLPAYDAYVYLAMAERPSFFTVAPWGYRVLTAWVVRALPVRSPVRAFRYVTLGALVGAGVLLALFLQRVGHGPWAALLAVAGFGLSPPVAHAASHVFLTEPMTLLVFTAFLWAVEAGAGPGVLGLLMAVGVLSKEVMLALVPLVFLDRHPRLGARRAAGQAILVAMPGLVVTALLRLWWAPRAGGSLPPLDFGAVRAGLDLVLGSWREWLGPIFLAGLTPLALAGALRRETRGFLRRYGYLAGVGLALPLLAGLYVGEARPAVFFADDVPRLLIYLLPVWLALGLWALHPVLPWREPPPPPRPHPLSEKVAAVATVCLLVSLPLGLDRYRRVDLRGSSDGPLVLALARESYRTAVRLDRGDTVCFDPTRQKYTWGRSDPGELGRMRWFLRDGWGDLAHYGVQDIRMRQPRASLLLPAFGSHSLDAVVTLEASQELRLAVFVNGRPVGEARAAPEAPESVIEIPGHALFRGDNLLELLASDGRLPLIRLRRLTYRRA